MKVSAIPNYNLNNINNKKTSNKINNNPSFKAFTFGYEDMLKLSMKKENIEFNEMERTFFKLINYALKDGRAFRDNHADILDGKSLCSILTKARKNRDLDVPLVSGMNPEHEFIRLSHGVLSFGFPFKEIHGVNTVDFWLNLSDEYVFCRPEHLSKYYYNKNRKEYYYCPMGGEIAYQRYYRPDGSDAVLKNFFFS